MFKGHSVHVSKFVVSECIVSQGAGTDPFVAGVGTQESVSLQECNKGRLP